MRNVSRLKRWIRTSNSAEFCVFYIPRKSNNRIFKIFHITSPKMADFQIFNSWLRSTRVMKRSSTLFCLMGGTSGAPFIFHERSCFWNYAPCFFCIHKLIKTHFAEDRITRRPLDHAWLVLGHVRQIPINQSNYSHIYVYMCVYTVIYT